MCIYIFSCLLQRQCLFQSLFPCCFRYFNFFFFFKLHCGQKICHFFFSLHFSFFYYGFFTTFCQFLLYIKVNQYISFEINSLLIKPLLTQTYHKSQKCIRSAICCYIQFHIVSSKTVLSQGVSLWKSGVIFLLATLFLSWC